MCGAQEARIGAGAPPAYETRQERIARIIKFKKLAGTWGEETAQNAPSLTDAAAQDAATSAAQRARMSRGRRSTMLTPGSIGDTSTLVGP